MSIMAPILPKPLVTKPRVHKHLRHVLMLRDGTPKERLLVFKNGPSTLDTLTHDLVKDTLMGHINIKLGPNDIKKTIEFRRGTIGQTQINGPKSIGLGIAYYHRVALW